MAEEKKVYTVELTEEQMRVTQKSLEFYFRLMLGQGRDFSDEIAAMNRDFDPNNPLHEQIFDGYINRRNDIEEIMHAVFRIAYGPYGVPKAKSTDMLIAECIWDAIRSARGVSRWDHPMPIGPEPLPKITCNIYGREGEKDG